MSAKHSFTIVHDDIQMNVLAMGQGDPVLFIHGFAGGADSWYFNTRPLSQRFLVYAMDLPGFGRSSKVARPEFLVFFSEWLVRLLDLNGHAGAHVVGNSMGGAVALNLALAHPDRVQRLVLVDPVGLGPHLNEGSLRAIIESQTVEEVRAALAPLFHNLNLLTPEMVDRLYRYKQDPDVSSVLRELGSQLVRGGEALVDFRPRLNAIRARTLVMWGREDRLIPVSHLDHAHAIPNVRTHIFENCGHIPQVEMSEVFNNLLFEFLTSP
jgi:pyruvate dehydrogenase E2 component (dihydrolipoamide acetyltransferase)